MGSSPNCWWFTSRREPNRKGTRRLRYLGKLEELGELICGQELQHLQHESQTLGTILGRQRRRDDPFLRRTKRWRDGLLDRRHAAAERHKIASAFAVLQSRPKQSSAIQSGLDGRRQDLEG